MSIMWAEEMGSCRVDGPLSPKVLACRIIAALVIVPLFIPALHKPLRRLLRPGVLFHVHRGLEWVIFAQRHQSAVASALFTWSCLTVTVTFYATFLPALIWVGLPQLGWRLALLMAACIYIGNAVKDLISAPRPAGMSSGGAAAKLISPSEEASYALEYGMPSSHTMNSLVLNGYAAYFLLQHGFVSAAAAPWLAAATVAWTLWIGLARIYLGLHTPIDIAGGLVAGVVTLGAYISVDNAFDVWLMDGLHVGGVMLVCWALMLRLHPQPVAYTPSYEYSVSFAGVAFGLATGLRRAKHLHHTGALLPLLWRQAGALAIGRRLILGFCLMLCNKAVAKQTMLTLLPAFYALYPVRLRRLWQPPVQSLQEEGELGIPLNSEGMPWDVDVTARFFGYASIGWTVSEICPRLFDLLGW